MIAFPYKKSTPDTLIILVSLFCSLFCSTISFFRCSTRNIRAIAININYILEKQYTTKIIIITRNYFAKWFTEKCPGWHSRWHLPGFRCILQSLLLLIQVLVKKKRCKNLVPFKMGAVKLIKAFWQGSKDLLYAALIIIEREGGREGGSN